MKKVNFILLAGGKGSRMKVETPKVLYPIDDGVNQFSSFQRILNLINSIKNIEKKIYAVISTEIDENEKYRKQIPSDIFSIVQKEKKGTGHAVQIISKHLDKTFEDCIIIYCDHPLITQNTILSILKTLEKHLLCNLSFFKEEKNNYGKCIIDDNLSDKEHFIMKNISEFNKEDFYLQTISIKDILEEKDIQNREQCLNFCNAGVHLKTDILLKNIHKIPISNQTQEIYLTKIAELIHKNESNYLNKDSSKCVSLIVPEEEVIAFNSLEELAIIEKIYRNK